MSSNLVSSLFEDQAGTLWVGTMGGGVNRIDRSSARFAHYFHHPYDRNSLNNNIVEAIWEDRTGVLWIGTTGGGLNRFERTTGQWRHFRNHPDDPYSLSNDIVGSILEDHSGALWIGTAFGGLNKLDRASERFTRYLPDPNDPDHTVSHSGIRALYQDHRGMLWIGTHGDGINVLDPETGQVIHRRHDPNDPYSLGNNWIYTLYEDREGTLWIGTRDGGLDRFHQETERFTHYRHDPSDPQSLGNGSVQAIYQDRSGVLWVGTEGGGVNKLNQERKTFSRYGRENGLPSSSVFAILEDEGGYLWLSTGNGVSRFDPRTESFRNYDTRDGLQGNVFIAGASYKSSGGEMFLGGFNGFNAFYPERIKDNSHVPPIFLTALTQGGRDIDVGMPIESVGKLTLYRPSSFFEFEFAALNYTQAEKNQYAYVLEGFDDGWQYVGTRRFGRYGVLPAGEYVLRVTGSNNDGLWNEEGLAIQITVVPQVWETWWFWGMITLLLAGGTFGVYRLRVRSIKARNRQLEGIVAERTSQLEAFYLAEERMHRHLQLDQVLQALVDVAVEVLQADKSAVFVWDGEQERWVMRIARGFGPEAMTKLCWPGERARSGT